MNHKFFTINELAERIGVSASTLRAWESRYQFFAPERTTGGHRVYSESELKLFVYINHLRDEGHRLVEIAKMSKDHLKTQSELYFENANMLPKLSQCSSSFKDRVSQQIVSCLEKMQFNEALLLIERAAALTPRPDEFAQLAVTILREVGLSWSKNRLSIASEHMVTAHIKFHLGEYMIRHRQENTQTKFRFIVAGLPNDMHEINLLCASLLLQAEGFEVIYLGPHIELESLLNFSQDFFKKDRGLLCLSASSALPQRKLIESLAWLDHHLAPHHLTIVGGSCLNSLQRRTEEFSNLLLTQNFQVFKILREKLGKNSKILSYNHTRQSLILSIKSDLMA